MSATHEIRIRMYRGVLGDCFLLTHVRGEKKTRILIDCGVLQNVDGGPEQIGFIVDDLIRSVEGTIDVLVMTHEHEDHLSGFVFHHKKFLTDKLKINRLWLAWTEKVGNPQADALREKFKKVKKALHLTAALANEPSFAKDDRAQLVARLANFIGAPDRLGADETPKKRGRMSCGEVIELFKNHVGEPATSYLEPGGMEDIAPGLKAYVLGPPRDEASLRKDSPSSGANKEVYLTGVDEAVAVASAAAAALAQTGLRAAPEIQALAADNFGASPFPTRHHRRIDDVKPRIHYRRQEGDLDDLQTMTNVERLYFHPRFEVRKIDGDWLEAAETLALKMDSDTNNTSLVLAFETEDGQVLLFPGDAQVGNWLSWGKQKYPTPKTGDPPPAQQISVDDILKRVTLYKVGHHCSHNATARKEGLEKMTDPELVAMIPVVEDVAAIQGKGKKEPGKGWKMPYKDLYERLQEKTRHRVVRGDIGIDKEKAAFAAVAGGPALEYGPDQGKYGPLWVEIAIPIKAPVG